MGRSKYQQEIEDAQEVLTATLEELGFDLSVGEYSLRGLVNMVCNRAESQADNLKRIWAAPGGWMRCPSAGSRPCSTGWPTPSGRTTATTWPS